jgi:hypothetical protein
VTSIKSITVSLFFCRSRTVHRRNKEDQTRRRQRKEREARLVCFLERPDSTKVTSCSHWHRLAVHVAFQNEPSSTASFLEFAMHCSTPADRESYCRGSGPHIDVDQGDTSDGGAA